jgi:hypothetical protein
MICKLARFYPSYKVQELGQLPKKTLDAMWEAITIIEAQEQLKLLTALDWQNMKKEQRAKTHRELFRQAYPSSIKEKNYVSVEDLQRVFGGRN